MDVRKLNDLKATNPYLRLGTDVSELEKSIQTVGLIAPLVISPDNVILAGARRYQALLNLGFTEARVLVVDLGELEMELVSIDENLVRKDLTKIEIEGHLRRAKEIYQALNPIDEVKVEIDNKTILPNEKFLNMVSLKTGLSPKQIHEAINRDEMAANNVKEARKNGDLSLSQTNEIIKLNKDEQQRSLTHLKKMPVREIKNFVKIAKVKGVETAIQETNQDPNTREFLEIEMSLKKLLNKFKQLELEGIELVDLPEQTQKLFKSVMKFGKEDLKDFEGVKQKHSTSVDSSLLM
ncbi:MAG: ParB N-terminal domain-containing protein [Bacteriovoracaceae bacterium]|nr:ParB N-terminal domain-containing protein [Bacteriovoracaceae bacterium]